MIGKLLLLVALAAGAWWYVKGRPPEKAEINAAERYAQGLGESAQKAKVAAEAANKAARKTAEAVREAADEVR